MYGRRPFREVGVFACTGLAMNCHECEDCERHDPTLAWYSCRWTGAQVAAQDLALDWLCPRCLLPSEAMSAQARMAARTVLVLASERGLLDELLAHYTEDERLYLRALMIEAHGEHRHALRAALTR